MRYIDEDLLDCLRRPDAYTEYAVEVSAPDVGQVLRRASDQFFSEPPGIAGSGTGSLAQAATGGLQIAATGATVATFAAGGGPIFSLRQENAQRVMRGVAWAVDPAFSRATARTFTADVNEAGTVLSSMYAVLTPLIDWQLQVYRVTRTPGQLVASPFTQYAFTPLLSPAPIIKAANVAWAGSTGSRTATLSWDLSAYGLTLDATPNAGLDPNAVTELPIYLFVIQPINGPDDTTDWYRWRTSASGVAQTIAGVGKFTREYWTRSSDEGQWAQADYTDTPACSLLVDSFSGSASKVYLIDLGRAPSAGTVGRVVFERQLPRGTAATLELATAGSSGPWTPVQSGDVVSAAQQQYWLRVTLTPDTAHRSSPIVNGFGIEFRVPYDVGDLSIAATPARDIAPPYLAASIAEAQLRVLRVGERDYLDPATILGSTAPTSKLEVDIYLRSRLPLILNNRAKWLHLERLVVSDRDPGTTSEVFSLLSYAKNLAVKLPAQVETINTVHTVQSGTTATAVKVSPVLLGTSVSGNEYDGKSYYVRIRSTATAGIPVGSTVVIQGNTGTDQLDFASTAFPAALTPGDVIEVHSGITTTARLKWVDEDPAVIWDDILALCPNVSADRIGRGDLPRSGRPPTVATRFPGDTTSQAKAKLSLELKDATEASKLLDQVSFWMGGATIELGGQICYVQIYPLTAIDGTVTVPVAPVAAVFDSRDLVTGSLKTTPNVASRKAVVTAKYGTNNAAADPSQYPTRVTRAVDADAVDWLSKGDLSFIGAEDVSDDLCRWLYNSSDLGLMMAGLGTRQVCLACSTGIRVFPFQTIDAHPELTFGDTVVVITDQYTDYDPARRIALSGWLAIRGVVVHIGPDARDFGIFVLGLADGVKRIAGGAEGSLSGLGDAPGAPAVSGSYTAAGHPQINLTPGARTGSVRIVAASGSAPSLATVQGAAAIDAPFSSMLFPGATVAVGDTGYIGVIAYTGTGGTGVASPLYTFEIVRDASGAAATPTPTAVIDILSEDASQIVLVLSGALGTGDPGPLEYRWRNGMGAWSAYGTTHPNQTITRLPKLTQVIQLQTRQSDGQESDIFSFPVTGSFVGIDTGTGKVDPAQPLSGTSFYIPHATDTNGWILETNTKDNRGRLLNTGFQANVDTAAAVVETAGLGFADPSFLDAHRPHKLWSQADGLAITGSQTVDDYRRSTAGFRDQSGGLTSAANDTRGALINNHFRYGTDSSNGVVDGTGSPIAGGKRGFSTIDSLNRVYRANGFDDGYYAIASTNSAGTALHGSVADSRAALVNAMFRASVDTAASVVPTTGRGFVANVDGSNLITPSSSSGRSRVRAVLSVVQSISNNFGTTISFGAEDYNVGGLHSNSVNPSRITIPSGGNVGAWMLIARVVFDPNATGDRLVAIYKNGGFAPIAQVTQRASAIGQHVMASVVEDAPAAGDYYEVQVLQTSGGSLNVSNGWFSAVHLW